MLNATINLLLKGTLETIYMVLMAGVIAILGGIPLGVLLFTTRRTGILENRLYNKAITFVVNVIRSIPFIILLIALIPFTRLLIGTAIGTTAAIIPLSIAAIPFAGRIVESSLLKVGHGLIETGVAMGATSWQIITKIMLPESLPLIIYGLTTMFISLVGYSAMAGAVGGGGLGSVAINYGYQRFDVGIMLSTIIILILLVHIIQYYGDFLARKFTH